MKIICWREMDELANVMEKHYSVRHAQIQVDYSVQTPHKIHLSQSILIYLCLTTDIRQYTQVFLLSSKIPKFNVYLLFVSTKSLIL